MTGSRWVCMFREVALGFGLTNSLAGIDPATPPLPPLPPPPSPPPDPILEVEMPSAYNLQ